MGLMARAAAESTDEKEQCVVRPFGRETSTASFALYTFSIAVFLQALVLVTFSPVADYGMSLLCVFPFVCCWLDGLGRRRRRREG